MDIQSRGRNNPHSASAARTSPPPMPWACPVRCRGATSGATLHSAIFYDYRLTRGHPPVAAASTTRQLANSQPSTKPLLAAVLRGSPQCHLGGSSAFCHAGVNFPRRITSTEQGLTILLFCGLGITTAFGWDVAKLGTLRPWIALFCVGISGNPNLVVNSLPRSKSQAKAEPWRAAFDKNVG